MAVDVKNRQTDMEEPRSSIQPKRPGSCAAASSIAAPRSTTAKLFRTTLDANVIALDAATGKELWRQKAADIKEGYSMTVAPLVADGGRLGPASPGAEFGNPRFHRRNGIRRPASICGETNTIPSPDEPGGDTWKGDTWKLGGRIDNGSLAPMIQS